MQTVWKIDSSERGVPAVQAPRRLSFLRFLLRYPIFLLAFGPPQFKQAVVGVDTSQAHFSLWNVLQVGWLCLIALRAILRLATAHSILIPKQTRSILKLFFFMGLLFLASVAYSPGWALSTEFVILYFLNLTCMVEFIVDAYQNPPNWMQCIFELRFVALLLLAAVLLTLPFAPSLVMAVVPGAGIRLLGGSVAAMSFYPEMIAIISAYTFLHSLESRVRSAFLFLVGLAGTLVTQARGAELSLLLVLTILATGWARMSKRSAYIFVAGLMAFILFGGLVIGSIGGERIWKTVNRGQDTADIMTASGRTLIWMEVIEYCVIHPQGMGYIAGLRSFYRPDKSMSLHAFLTTRGIVDNSYLQVLADAGWLALALYLTMLVKTVALGWRSMKKSSLVVFAPDSAVSHALRCALLLLLFCLAEGMEGVIFAIPMQGAFYCQNILIVIILGASASVLTASRSQQPFLAG
jgi:hypothetical protein